VSRFSGPGDYSGGTNPRQKVKEQKRKEAFARNEQTPPERRSTKAWFRRMNEEAFLIEEHGLAGYQEVVR
jgi:hypothetical protein